MENKGQNTHLLFDCGFFCHAKLCTLADLHQTSGFFGGHPERSATQICPVCLIHFRMILYLLIVQHREIFVFLLLCYKEDGKKSVSTKKISVTDLVFNQSNHIPLFPLPIQFAVFRTLFLTQLRNRLKWLSTQKKM